ncbi:UbiA family prenyltransferase, partial [Streptomyces xiaopingdaonensis]|uniref:UbiA family prenyltransferase n=1 Tax=Streptomyces xiaopingdaonensis TaxID=1565415 RepID=UPI00052561D8
MLLLRSCSVRFTAYYWVGFTAGLAANGRLTPGWALLGVPMWLAYCLGTEALNRIADQEADAVNRPERTALCEEFGWDRLLRVTVASWIVFVLVGAALVWVHPGAELVAILLVDIGVAVGYSVGPAFKRHRVLSLLALTAPLVTPLLTGWAVHAATDTLLSPVLPAAAVLAAFSLGLSGIKDITDVAGDRRLNYSSLWLRLVALRRGAAVYAMIGTPFVLLLLFAVRGALPWTVTVLLPLVAVSALVVAAAGRAAAALDREAAREVMHQYTFYFLVLVLLTATPGAGTAAATAAAVVHWAVASKQLHWSGGLTKAHLRRWSRLLARPSTVK